MAQRTKRDDLLAELIESKSVLDFFLLFSIGFVLVLCVYVPVWIFGKQYMFVSFDEIFFLPPNIFAGAGCMLVLLVWSSVAYPLSSLWQKIWKFPKDPPINVSTQKFLSQSTLLSLNAGVFEELTYRWLLFSISMVVATLLNGMSFGLLERLMNSAILPLANVLSFGALHEQLDGSVWQIGAAIVFTTILFSMAHKGTGFNFAIINSTITGTMFFYIMFHYGIYTAITAHCLVNLYVFCIGAVVNTRELKKASQSNSALEEATSSSGDEPFDSTAPA